MQNLEFCFRLAPQKKCAQKARKVSNTIQKQKVPNEKQAIVIYAPHLLKVCYERYILNLHMATLVRMSFFLSIFFVTILERF
jgi:hypothetical protein